MNNRLVRLASLLLAGVSDLKDHELVRRTVDVVRQLGGLDEQLQDWGRSHPGDDEPQQERFALEARLDALNTELVSLRNEVDDRGLKREYERELKAHGLSSPYKSASAKDDMETALRGAVKRLNKHPLSATLVGGHTVHTVNSNTGKNVLIDVSHLADTGVVEASLVGRSGDAVSEVKSRLDLSGLGSLEDRLVDELGYLIDDVSATSEE